MTMRMDQLQMLDDLAEKLADVFIVEADPANWSGAGKLPADLTREERGDRSWDRKGAMGTGGVLKYVLDIKRAGLERDSKDPDTNHERESDLDRQIGNAEKAAREAMERVMGRKADAPEG
jgi:hypothetical protein